MKTILFIASELPGIPDVSPARCLDLSKCIQEHIDNCKTKNYFTLRKWEQPEGADILKQIKHQPAFIQYCGHGNDFGDWQLPPVEGYHKGPYSFESYELEEALERALHVECLLLGSCNSDVWAEKLKLYADFSIGFTNEPSADLVYDFYDKFYLNLVKYGDPLKAYWYAKKMIKVNKYAVGRYSDIILTSKHKHIMELIQKEDQRRDTLKGKIADTVAELDGIQSQIAGLAEKEQTLYSQLLHEHPFGKDVVEFILSKEMMTYNIAHQLATTEDDVDEELMQNSLYMLFDILESLLLSCEERDLVRQEVRPLLVNLREFISHAMAKRAFRLLEAQDLFLDLKVESFYRTLLTDSTQYCLSVLKSEKQ